MVRQHMESGHGMQARVRILLRPEEAKAVEEIENENTVALNKLNCAGAAAVE